MGRPLSDNLLAVLDHAQKVIATRDHPDRSQRRDLVLVPDLRRRLGEDTAGRLEAMIGVALAAQDLIELRRRRDTLLARGQMPAAQKIGAQIAAVEQTIEDLVAVITAGQDQIDEREALSVGAVNAATHCTKAKPSTVSRELMAARRRVALAVILEMVGRGEKNHTAMARALDARGLPAPMGGTWTGSQVAALLQRAGSPLDRPAQPVAVRQVRTRTRSMPEAA